MGPGGSVSSLDISADSVALLKSRINPGLRVEAVAADMGDLSRVIQERFSVKRYSLAHSSYALYYSPKRLDVLDMMRAALKPGGRCAVFTPNRPHGLVELAARFTTIPREVEENISFWANSTTPVFRKAFPTRRDT